MTPAFVDLHNVLKFSRKPRSKLLPNSERRAARSGGCNDGVVRQESFSFHNFPA
jgi:hypothetical protein